MTIAEYIQEHQAARVARAEAKRKVIRRRDRYTALLMGTVEWQPSHMEYLAAPLNWRN